MTSRWATTTRLAWRFLGKSRVRSALIAVLVALPVLAGTFVAVTVRTAELSPSQAAQRYLGNADAIAVVIPYRKLDPALSQVGYAGGYASEPAESISTGEGTRDSGRVDLPALLPAGSRAIPAGWQRYLMASSPTKRTLVTGVLLDLADPLAQGLYDVRSGRAPRAGEVAVSAHLADRLDLKLGSQVGIDGASPRVVAIVNDPSSLDADEIVGPAASLGGMNAFPGRTALQNADWLISYPAHRAPDLHDVLAAHGVIYETRTQWEQPSANLRQNIHVNSQGRAILGSVIGFGLAEIVLLAGTAFAVGVRRQVRELGLLRAVGGDERDVRRVILAQGVLLGLAGAILGVGLGFLTFMASRTELESVANRTFGPLDARAAEIIGIAAIGVVAALLAAVVPARTSAAYSVLDMLRTRFRVDGGAARVPRWAVSALVVGPAVVIVAAVGWHRSSGGFSGATATSLRSVVSAVSLGSHQDGRWTALVSLGAALTLAGIARACPALITRLGNRAGRYPLSLRLALRDAARHRHRTAPAVAAVTTVVAGAVLVLMVLSSTDVNNRRSYFPQQPVGTVSVSIGPTHDSSLTQLAATTTQVTGRLGGGTSGVLGRAELPHAHRNDRLALTAPGCGRHATCDAGPVGVGTPDLVALLTGHDNPGVATMLANGGAVAFRSDLTLRNTISVGEIRFRHGRETTTRVALHALIVPVPTYSGLPGIIVSAATAGAHGWATVAQEGLIRPSHVPSQSTADHLGKSLGNSTALYVERGYHSGMGVVLLALLGGAALAVLLGTSIAVALAMVESRPDMATFAAVGASPARRRQLAMGQAAAVGWLGTVLGLLLGLLVGSALLEGSTSYPFSLPWRWLGLLVLAAPALAVGVAGAVTRSRVPMTRRIA